MKKSIFRRSGVAAPLLLFLWLVGAAANAGDSFAPVVANDGIMPEKEVVKLTEMGAELYEKTGVPVFVAAVDNLKKSPPVDFIEGIKASHPTYILLYFSLHPTTVNIFAAPGAEKLADFDQILSPLPWRGTIRPVMSPVFSKDKSAKLEVAILNGYADLVDQVAASKGVSLKSSIGSESKTSFLIVRWIFYGTLLFLILQFFYIRYIRKSRG